MQTQVKDVMKSHPVVISPDATLKEAAQRMESLDCGVLPIGAQEKLEGIITDRDIVIRALAKGKDISKEKVKNYMTPQVHYCNADDTLEEAAKQMYEGQVSRLVVKDRNGKMCGILSFGCILRKHSDAQEISHVVECAVGKNAA